MCRVDSFPNISRPFINHDFCVAKLRQTCFEYSTAATPADSGGDVYQGGEEQVGEVTPGEGVAARAEEDLEEVTNYTFEAVDQFGNVVKDTFGARGQQEAEDTIREMEYRLTKIRKARQ